MKHPVKGIYRALISLIILGGCQTAGYHAEEVRKAQGDAESVTVGTVQKEIRVGMSGAEVAAALGSPNIVSTDEQRREVWIYDKISTNRVYSQSSGGINTLILGGALTSTGLVGGGGGLGYSSGSGASSTSQRTLTVIIKYDEDKKVRDFAYHTSRF